MPTWDAFGQILSAGPSATVASFTVADQPDRILLAAVVPFYVTPPVTCEVTSVVWNTSENFTYLTTLQTNSYHAIQIWYLLNPTATTASIVATLDETERLHLRVAAAYDVLQKAPNHYAIEFDDSIDITSDTDEIVWDSFIWADDSSNYTVGSGQTERGALTDSGAGIGSEGRSSTEPGASGSVTMSWVWDTVGSPEAFVHGAVSLEPPRPIYDTVGSNVSAGQTVTVSSLTVGNHANRILIAVAYWRAYSTNDAVVSSIVFNTSESFAAVGSIQRDGQLAIQYWYLLAPTVTTANVVFTLNGDQQDIHLHVVSAYNCKQAAPGHYGTDSDNNVSVTSDVDEFVIGTIGWSNSAGSFTEDGTQTYRCSTEASVDATNNHARTSTDPGATPTKTMSWTQSGSPTDWLCAAVSLEVPDAEEEWPPAGAGPALWTVRSPLRW